MKYFRAFLNGLGAGMLVASLLFSYDVRWQILGYIGSFLLGFTITSDLLARRKDGALRRKFERGRMPSCFRKFLLKERTFAALANIPNCAEDDIACRERMRQHLIRGAALRVVRERAAGRCIIAGPVFIKVKRPDGTEDLFCQMTTATGRRLSVYEQLIKTGLEPLDIDLDATKEFLEALAYLSKNEEK